MPVIPIDSTWLTANGPAPYPLLTAGATYQLAADVTADGTAFVVAAAGITLDLNTHAVTYNDAALPLAEDFEGVTVGSLPAGWSATLAGGVTAAVKLASTGPYYLFGTKVLEVAGLPASLAATVTAAGGGTTTITTGSAHSYSTGNTVLLCGFPAGLFASPQTVTVTSATAFTVPVTIGAGNVGGGGFVAKSYAVLKTPTVTLPATNQWYVGRCACTCPGGTQGSVQPFVACQVLRASDDAVLADSGTATRPVVYAGGGYNAVGAVVPYFGTETSVYLKFYVASQCTNPTAVALDQVKLCAGWVNGIVASNEFNFPGYANLPAALQWSGVNSYNHAGTFTLTDSAGGGSVTQGAGKGSFCHAVNAETLTSPLAVSNVHVNTNGDDTGFIFAFQNGNGGAPTTQTKTVSNCTLAGTPPQDVANRFDPTRAVDCTSTSGNVAVTNNTISNVFNQGIAVTSRYTATPPTAAITDNTVTGAAAITNSYMIALGGMPMSVLRNTVHTDGAGQSGEGIAIDTNGSSLNAAGEVAHNTVVVKSTPWRDYGTGEPERAFRLRNDVGGTSDGNFVNLSVHDNSFTATADVGLMPVAYGAWLTVFDNPDNPTRPTNLLFESNTFTGIATPADASTYRGYGLVLDGIDPGLGVVFRGNTCVSNDTALLEGTGNEGSRGIADVLSLGNALNHPGSGDQARTFVPAVLGGGGTATTGLWLVSCTVDPGSGARALAGSDLTLNGGTPVSYHLGWRLTPTVRAAGVGTAGAAFSLTDAAAASALAAPLAVTTTNGAGHPGVTFGGVDLAGVVPVATTTAAAAGGSPPTATHTPHAAAAAKAGYAPASQSLTLTADTTLTLDLGATMANDLTHATALRTDLANLTTGTATTYAAGASQKLIVYSGTEPANAAASLSGNVAIATITVLVWGAGSAGVCTITGSTADNSAVGGTGTFVRVTKSDGTTCIFQASLATSGDPATINNVVINAGANVSLTSGTYTAPV